LLGAYLVSVLRIHTDNLTSAPRLNPVSRFRFSLYLRSSTTMITMTRIVPSVPPPIQM
jgi:hypothetical protein